jgi:hypothetical protein
MPHDLEWLTAPPLWDLALADPVGRARFREPALLRFASDAFMEELPGLLGGPVAAPGAGLAARVARPETWERPAAGWAAAGDPSLAAFPKLYQPAHGRFYLAAASLVCRRAGLPGRKVEVAKGDLVGMLVRRLVPAGGGEIDPADPGSFAEQAWVGDRKAGAWKPVGDGAAPLAGEERLPVFPLTFTAEEGRKRQLWAGLVPVAGREVYEGAAPSAAAPPLPAAPGDPLAALEDPRKASYFARVQQGLLALTAPEPPLPDVDPGGEAAASRREDVQESLAFVLLDLVDFLAAELAPVWEAVQARSSAGLADGPRRDVWDGLGAAFAGTATWRDALLAAEAHRPALLGTGTGTGPEPVPASFTWDDARDAAIALVHGGLFQEAVFAALGEPPPAPPAPPGEAGGAPAAAALAARSEEPEGALYRVRFVYERPRCGALDAPAVSAPSRAFRLASFFDPDAPARPLVIRMPFDTSPKGLRRFPKGVAVLMSNKLRQQVERVQGQKLADLDEGKVGDEPGWSLGMICSLSIPIITLCAFLVLMIFIQLFNIVFWWMAFFKICLPIPVKSE